MNHLHRTDEFDRWLCSLRDPRARARIQGRLQRLAEGNPGDVKAAREGVSEMRIDCGTGYRVYFTRRGRVLVVLLRGGGKGTQDSDVIRAIRQVRELKE